MLMLLGVIAVAIWTGVGLYRSRLGEEPHVLVSTFIAALIFCVAPFMSLFGLGHIDPNTSVLHLRTTDWVGITLMVLVLWGLYERTDPIRMSRFMRRRTEDAV